MLCAEAQLIERAAFFGHIRFFALVSAYSFPTGHEMQGTILRIISDCFNNDAFLSIPKDWDAGDDEQQEGKRLEWGEEMLEGHEMARNELFARIEKKYGEKQKGSAFKWATH